jgi:hypothetical protein
MTYRLTRDEPKRFTAAFNFLSTSKNAKHDDVKLEASFLTLGDLPIEAVELAARTLSKESNSFMVDDGTWYETADNIAAETLVRNTEKARYLTAPKIEQEEKSETLKARKAFVELFEKFAGKTLSISHPWKSDQVNLMTFHCVSCSDIGWRNSECTTDNLCKLCRTSKQHLYDHGYVFRCTCWMTNPLLEARRASAKLSYRRKSNAR